MALLSQTLRSRELKTAVLVLGDGTVFKGYGLGAVGAAVGEVCFNTSMTGYQEILTDPSYAGQMITFTFPHIGNIGANDEDIENLKPHALGLIIREDITSPSNYRALMHLDTWLKKHNMIGICGVDTRALTKRIRDQGAPNGCICHSPSAEFDLKALTQKASDWSGLEGLDLAKDVSCQQPYEWDETEWTHQHGYRTVGAAQNHVVVIDYGVKRNILRCLATQNCRITVVPAKTSAKEILALNPDGVMLSNGPGDPAATGVYAVPVIQELIKEGLPIFGICLGHQMLGIALGGKTFKLKRGHRGANHPVKEIATGKVEITSQNHGFAVDPQTLPKNIVQTHVSLFDGSNEGIKIDNAPVFSVQYHPEASPGPKDSHYLFLRFMEYINLVKEAKRRYA